MLNVCALLYCLTLLRFQFNSQQTHKNRINFHLFVSYINYNIILCFFPHGFLSLFFIIIFFFLLFWGWFLSASQTHLSCYLITLINLAFSLHILKFVLEFGFWVHVLFFFTCFFPHVHQICACLVCVVFKFFLPYMQKKKNYSAQQI